MEVTTSTQVSEVQLVKGQFTPSQAKEVLVSLLDQKINYHLIEKHQKWEKDHNCDMTHLNQRIEELEDEKEKVKNIFSAEMNDKGRSVRLNGTIEISFID